MPGFASCGAFRSVHSVVKKFHPAFDALQCVATIILGISQYSFLVLVQFFFFIFFHVFNAPILYIRLYVCAQYFSLSISVANYCCAAVGNLGAPFV